MSSEPIDPAAIMADHHGTLGEACYGDNYDCPYLWPCPTYRLAAEVTRLRAAEQRVRAVWSEGFLHDDEYEFSTSGDCQGTWEQRWRRTPALHADAGAWERVGDRIALDGGQP